MAPLRNTYVNCQTNDGRPVPWFPPERPEGVKPDAIYFGSILAEMDRLLRDGGLTVYLTQDLEELPSYGADVVVVHVGDEFTQVPRYFGKVRAIFKNYAIRPVLTANVLREPTWANFCTTAWYARTWAFHLPGFARYRRARRRGEWVAPIWRVPVGVFDQVPLPLKPPAERRYDVFFGGSVSHQHGASTKERVNPKVIARADMVEQAERLAAKRPDLSVELVTTDAFADSVDADADAYSRRLMDSRIALVPRGTGIDTFRLWQALRFGCVAVVDTVPRHPIFYDGVPVVRLARWNQLETEVPRLLADHAELEAMHKRSLEWWSSRGSPEAVGAYMADKLDSLSS